MKAYLDLEEVKLLEEAASNLRDKLLVRSTGNGMRNCGTIKRWRLDDG
jgi:hypothetical protein